MISQLAENILEQVKIKYPHLEFPAAMKAVITAATPTGEMLEQECKIKDKATGEDKEAVIAFKKYEYAIRVTDNDGIVLEDYPVLSGICSSQRYEVGAAVVVVFTGGELNPVIMEG